MNFQEVTFAILAGGQGSRLGGCVKGLLEIDGVTVFERVLRTAQRFENRLLITNDAVPYERFGVPSHGDVERGFGAPGGVITTLVSARTPWVLITACDMPFTTEAMALRLFELSEHADVACFTREGRDEPLFALYRQSLGNRWLGELRQQRSLRALLASVRVRSEPLSDPHALDSLNTPDDLQRHRVLRKF